jgi:ubiquitin-like 1-activating enzyme E1 A
MEKPPQRKPGIDDLDKFGELVSSQLATLHLPSSVCTSAHVREFVERLTLPDLSGVASVVGGILSQDVLNALGGRELPLKNWLIFDGRSCTLHIEFSNVSR